MPPGPAYGWLCVAHSVTDILGKAAQIRAAQLEKTAAPLTNARRTPKTRAKRVAEDELNPPIIKAVPLSQDLSAFTAPLPRREEKPITEAVPRVKGEPSIAQVAQETVGDAVQTLSPPMIKRVDEGSLAQADNIEAAADPVVNAIDGEAPFLGVSDMPMTFSEPHVAPTAEPDPFHVEPVHVRKLQSSKVPASRIGRLFHYGGTLTGFSCSTIAVG